MSNKIPPKLKAVYSRFDSCKRCKNEGNELNHILGGGKFRNPKFLFLFINPTHRNISSHKDYSGERRFPFIGVRHFWKLFARAGFIDSGLIEDIYRNGWQTKDEERIEDNLIKEGVYISNLVKCTQPHPENPPKEIIRQELPLLKQEIRIVNPRYIVTFGKLPTKIITGLDVRLIDCLNAVKTKQYKKLDSVDILGNHFKVLPCFFPVGRGNPPKALKILKYIKERY
ncbi:MAG: hypothetical protein BMS9Abin34_037 [Patescibacteria group bacterium]|nr:MAG: hypothetical protein BMS9Abin34_037 [Patescibacteria group bacterium]